MSAARIAVGGVRLDPVTQEEAVSRILDLALDRSETSVVVTPNMDHVARLPRDPALQRVYSRAALVVADGWPVVLAARLLGGPRLGRVTGSDLTPAVAHALAQKGMTLGLLGGRPGAAAAAACALQERDPSLRVVLVAEAPAEQLASAAGLAELQDELRETSPDVLVLGLGTPKQELLADAAFSDLGVGAVLCTGAAIDFLGGVVKRAPEAWQRAGLEWLFRVLHEPRRLGPRYARSLLPFLAVVVGQRRAVRG